MKRAARLHERHSRNFADGTLFHWQISLHRSNPFLCYQDVRIAKVETASDTGNGAGVASQTAAASCSITIWDMLSESMDGVQRWHGISSVQQMLLPNRTCTPENILLFHVVVLYEADRSEFLPQENTSLNREISVHRNTWLMYGNQRRSSKKQPKFWRPANGLAPAGVQCRLGRRGNDKR